MTKIVADYEGIVGAYGVTIRALVSQAASMEKQLNNIICHSNGWGDDTFRAPSDWENKLNDAQTLAGCIATILNEIECGFTRKCETIETPEYYKNNWPLNTPR